jgi:hypothetical protein
MTALPHPPNVSQNVPIASAGPVRTKCLLQAKSSRSDAQYASLRAVAETEGIARPKRDNAKRVRQLRVQLRELEMDPKRLLRNRRCPPGFCPPVYQ